MKNNANLNGAFNDAKMKELENASVSNGVISQHINRLHQKAQLAKSQQKTNKLPHAMFYGLTNVCFDYVISGFSDILYWDVSRFSKNVLI